MSGKRHQQSPERIYIKREFYKIGCGACINSQLDKKIMRWKCIQEVEGHPNKSVKDCFYFRRKPPDR